MAVTNCGSAPYWLGYARNEAGTAFHYVAIKLEVGRFRSVNGHHPGRVCSH